MVLRYLSLAFRIIKGSISFGAHVKAMGQHPLSLNPSMPVPKRASPCICYHRPGCFGSARFRAQRLKGARLKWDSSNPLCLQGCDGHNMGCVPQTSVLHVRHRGCLFSYVLIRKVCTDVTLLWMT